MCGCPFLLFFLIDSFSSVCGDQYPNVVSDYPNISISAALTHILRLRVVSLYDDDDDAADGNHGDRNDRKW